MHSIILYAYRMTGAYLISGLSSLASAAFSGRGLVIGIVIGLAAFCYVRNRNANNAADAEAEENEGGKNHEEHY